MPVCLSNEYQIPACKKDQTVWWRTQLYTNSRICSYYPNNKRNPYKERSLLSKFCFTAAETYSSPWFLFGKDTFLLLKLVLVKSEVLFQRKDNGFKLRIFCKVVECLKMGRGRRRRLTPKTVEGKRGQSLVMESQTQCKLRILNWRLTALTTHWVIWLRHLFWHQVLIRLRTATRVRDKSPKFPPGTIQRKALNRVFCGITTCLPVEHKPSAEIYEYLWWIQGVNSLVAADINVATGNISTETARRDTCSGQWYVFLIDLTPKKFLIKGACLFM